MHPLLKMLFLKKFILQMIISWLFVIAIMVIWRNFQPTTLLFDQFCVMTVAIFGTYICIDKYLFPDWKPTQTNVSRERLLCAIISALLFFSTVQYAVLAIDRSKSLYILSWIHKQEFSKVRGGYVLQNKYVPMHESPSELAKEFDQRINEQISRKIVAKNTKQPSLSPIGTIILSLAQFLAKIFNLKGWFANE